MNIAKFLTPKASSIYLLDSQTVRQGLEKFKYHGYTAIPVLTESGEFYGCVSEGDFLRHLLQTGTVDLKVHERYKIREIMRQDFCPPLKRNSHPPPGRISRNAAYLRRVPSHHL